MANNVQADTIQDDEIDPVTQNYIANAVQARMYGGPFGTKEIPAELA